MLFLYLRPHKIYYNIKIKRLLTMAKEQIREFIIDHFLRGEGDIKNDESLFGAGIVDSLRLMELIAFIEKNFKISVNMSDVTITNFDTVSSISELVDKKTSGRKN